MQVGSHPAPAACGAVREAPGRSRAGSFRSEPEHAAETLVNVVHEGSGQLPDLGVEVGLVKSDQGSDIDDGVFGQAGGGRGQEHVSRHRREAGAGGKDRSYGGVQAAGVKGPGLDDQDRAALGGLAAVRFSEVSPPDAATLDHQSSWRARRRRPAAVAAAAESSRPAVWSASSICWVSDRDARSSRYMRAARAKNSERLMPSSAAIS